MNESTDGTQTAPLVMPTKVGIHGFATRTQNSRGWRAFARHDVLARTPRYSTQLFLGVAYVFVDPERLVADFFADVRSWLDENRDA